MVTAPNLAHHELLHLHQRQKIRPH